MEQNKDSAGQLKQRSPRHKAVAFERGTFGDQGQMKGYAASCETCGAVTFGGFANKTLAKAALEHAAVPSMIPDEAVEAAVATLHEGWYDHASPEQWQEIVRAVLEAAAPHMLADVWDDAYAKGRDRGEWEAAPVTKEPNFTNPYRSQA